MTILMVDGTFAANIVAQPLITRMVGTIVPRDVKRNLHERLELRS